MDSSSSKSSSTKGDVLEGGGVSSNVTLSDSSIFLLKVKIYSVNDPIALDDALVAPNDHVLIGKCNMRIELTKTQKESTYQVNMDIMKLSPCYKALLIIADVPDIDMHQFWFTISKIKDSASYQFKLDKKKFRIGVEGFVKFSRSVLNSQIKNLLNYLLLKKLLHSSKKLVTEEI
ncbi:hypothetical protein Tco_0647055 [Tanacetum coccineum]